MDKSSHLYHYLVLILGLSLSLVFFFYFRQNPPYQLLGMVCGCIFYSAWGIIHGLSEQRMSWHVALEYITLSLFVFALFFVTVSLK